MGIVRTIKNTASKLGAAAGFNTRAHKVAELGRIVKDLKGTQVNPALDLEAAKKLQVAIQKSPYGGLKKGVVREKAKSKELAANLQSNKVTEASLNAHERELARRTKRNIVIGAGATLAAGGIAAAGAGGGWEKAAKNIK